MTVFSEHFTTEPGSHWQRFVVGQGHLDLTGHSLRLANSDASSRRYTNAQIDDYQHVPRRAFPWRPPLTLTVRARFSHPGPPLVENGEVLQGTAGFGFWNDPFLMSETRVPVPPRAAWFFYSSPPSDMKLALETPGYGWKAATIDALRLPFFLLVPTAPLAVPLMNVRPLYRRLWPIGQRAIGVSEAQITVPMTEWHTYVLAWGTDSARFDVDGRAVLVTNRSPRGPLGLVIWLDNQYMIVTPWGRFRYGLLAKPGTQWLEIETVTVVAA